MSVYTLGMDIGSAASKCVILKDGKEITAKSLAGHGAGTSGPGRAVDAVFADSGLGRRDISHVLATGYGRDSFPDFADSRMSELSCHARGASFLFPAARTVIDIGGQDMKVLTVENGALGNFQMNDKCAAGTGRFLEVMSRVLEVKVEEMGEMGALSKAGISISSTCTVFAESEVISLLSKGTPICDIIAGLHRSVAVRAAGLVRRVGLTSPAVMTGGVALNGGVVTAMEETLGCEVLTTPLAQYVGALGAALIAYERSG